MLSERLLKVATPFTAVTGVVPERVLPPGFVPMAMAIDAELVVTTSLPASSTVTVTAGEMEAPAKVFEGWTLKTSFVAGPTVTLNGLLVAPVKPVEAAVRV